MKIINDWENVQENSSFETLPVGAYVCKILKVEDISDKEYLKVGFDIIEGEFKGYFMDQYNRFKDNSNTKFKGVINRSYKATALSFFKAFITAVEKSNAGYRWDFDEKKLVGKICVVVFREEEWYNDQNELKILVKPDEVRSTVALREGKIKIKERKKADNAPKNTPVNSSANPFANINNDFDISNDDLPF